MGSEVEYADCSVSFRLERAAGASAILFDARRIGGANGIGPSPVELCVSSLTAGGDDHCNTQAAAWTEDPAFANEPVSQQLTLSFPLPAGIDDPLVTITTRQLPWLDSLRTQ